MKFNLLNLEPFEFSSLALQKLKLYFNYFELLVPFSELQSNTGIDLNSIHVLWVRLNYSIDSSILSCFPNLKYIVSPTTGLNHIDLESCNKLGIKILSLKGNTQFLSKVTATAEHTFLLMLSLSRNLVPACNSVNSGAWNRDNFKGIQLSGKNLGIIGLGRLGSMLSEYALSFKMNVAFTDTNLDITNERVPYKSLHELISWSDFISLHIDYNEFNHNFFGKNEFALMKKNAFFINTSRGEVVDEHSLLSALRNNSIAGAAIDVLSNEAIIVKSLATHPLINYSMFNDNLIITPHIGGCTRDSLLLAEEFMCSQLIQSINS